MNTITREEMEKRIQNEFNHIYFNNDYTTPLGEVVMMEKDISDISKEEKKIIISKFRAMIKIFEEQRREKKKLRKEFQRTNEGRGYNYDFEIEERYTLSFLYKIRRRIVGKDDKN